MRVTIYPPVASDGGGTEQLVVAKGKLGQYKLLFGQRPKSPLDPSANSGKIFCIAPCFNAENSLADKLDSEQHICDSDPSLRHLIYNQKQNSLSFAAGNFAFRAPGTQEREEAP